jgi:hypothetical protein
MLMGKNLWERNQMLLELACEKWLDTANGDEVRI